MKRISKSAKNADKKICFIWGYERKGMIRG